MSNSIVLAVRYLVISISSIYTIKVLFNWFGDADYGSYTLASSIIVFANILNTVFITSINRYSSYNIGNKKNYKTIFQQIFYLNLGLSVVTFVILIVISIFFLYGVLDFLQFNFHKNHIYGLIALSFASLLSSISYPFQALLLSKDEFKIISYIDFLKSLLNLGLILLLSYTVFSNKFQAYAVYYLLITLFCLLILVLITVGKYKRYLSFKFKFDRILVKEIYALSSWNSLGTSAAIIENNLPTILIGGFFGTRFLAIFGVANQSISAFKGLINALQSAFSPGVIRDFGSGQSANGLITTQVLSKSLTFIYIALSIILFIECEYIFKIWLNIDDINLISFVFRALLIINFFPVVFISYSNVIQSIGKVKVFMVTTFISVLVSYFCIYILFKWNLNIDYYFIILIINAVISNLIFIHLANKYLSCDTSQLRLYYVKVSFFYFIMLSINVTLDYLFPLSIFERMVMYSISTALGFYVYISFLFSIKERVKFRELIKF
jgi:O-antigen/teichoic acid export membrane protein